MSFYWIKTKKILSLFHHVALLGIDRHIYNAFFFYFMTKLKKSRKHFRTIELYIFFTMVLFYYPILFFEVNKLRVIRKVAANVSFCLILLQIYYPKNVTIVVIRLSDLSFFLSTSNINEVSTNNTISQIRLFTRENQIHM